MSTTAPKLRAIPQVPPGTPMQTEFNTAVKENIEVITGRRQGGILPLASTAGTAEIIAKINEIIARIQP
jgi:hypothetical protein